MSSTTNFAQSEFRYDDGKSPLALLAETCRNIGVDTSTSKLTKSSIDHTKSSSKSSSSPTNSSSSSSLESTRKSNDSSCRLSVSPLKNGSDKSQSNLSVSSNNNNRISANSVPGSSTNTNLGLNGNSTTHNNNVKVNNNGSSHHSPNYTGTSVITVNNNNNREPTKFSFKPYEDHVTHKRTCLEDSRSLSAFTHNYPHQLQQQQSSRSPLNSDIKNNNKDNQYVNNNSVNASSSNKTTSSESTKRDSVTNGGGGGTPPTLPLTNGYDEPVNKKMQKYSSLESTSSSSSSTPSLSNTSSSTPSAVTKSNHNSSTNNNANTTTTSSAHTSDSPSSKSSNHHHHQQQQQHQLTVDNVNKFVPYSSISSYLHGLPHHPSAYDPATAARLNAAAAAVAGYCHSPSMCRDPFCPGCRFGAASNVLGQVSPCAAGCTQCSHVAAAAASPMTASSINLAAALHQANAAAASPYLNPGNAFYPLLPTPAHHPSAANHPNNPSAHQHQQPGNVNNNMNKLTCNWMANGNYCGKRFSTAEELHQHLRNHTSSDPSSVSALAFLGQYPHLDPMLTSPIAGLRRTAFDPVNRYHPYKPTFTNLPNGLTAGSPNMHHPSTHPASSPRTQMNLSYPPYGPYAGRLGPPIPP